MHSFVVKRVWCGGKYDYRGLWVKNTHPESCRSYFYCCLWDRMSESVGGDVGAYKPQQVGKNDRFTSPCSYGPDILSGSRHTAAERYKQTRGTPEEASSSTFSVRDSACEHYRGKESRLNLWRSRTLYYDIRVSSLHWAKWISKLLGGVMTSVHHFQ